MINLELISLFLLIAGFIIGLGAVTVIDIHGFLGRKSEYWTEATTRTHKVTKVLIWIGTLLALVAGIFYYQMTYHYVALILHPVVMSILILNGLFLSFSVSPHLLQKEKEGKASEILSKSWQTKITVSFIVSFIGWWFLVFLLAYALTR